MTQEPDGQATTVGRRRIWRFLPLVLVLAGLGAFFATGSQRFLRLEALADNRDRLQDFVADHRIEAVLLYVLVYVGAVTLSVPGGAVLTMIGGFLFGWLAGGAVAAVSATIGAIGVYFVARTSIGDALLRRAGTRVQKIAAGFQEDAFSYLLFLRFLPVVPFWLTNLASALFGVPFKTFVLATQIGLIPGSFAFAVAGSGLDDVIASQQEARDACLSQGGADCGFDLAIGDLLTPQILVAFVALAVLALAPVVVKRFYGARLKGLADE